MDIDHRLVLQHTEFLQRQVLSLQEVGRRLLDYQTECSFRLALFVADFGRRLLHRHTEFRHHLKLFAEVLLVQRWPGAQCLGRAVTVHRLSLM